MDTVTFSNDSKALTPRQRRFVNNYLTCKTGAAAARESGYAASGSRVRACELLSRSDIQSAIAARRADLERTLEITPELIAERLLHAYHLADSATEMTNAAKELGLLMGYYPTK